jgi:hypothetical protein
VDFSLEVIGDINALYIRTVNWAVVMGITTVTCRIATHYHLIQAARLDDTHVRSDSFKVSKQNVKQSLEIAAEDSK